MKARVKSVRDQEPSRGSVPKRPKSLWRRFLKLTRWGCGTIVVLLLAVVGLGYLLISLSIPKTYPPVQNPIAAPDPADNLGGSLDGFDSPYIGHTGSWDGKGGAIFGRSKLPALDAEAAMGLRWTFMCVYWRAMEPDGPVDLSDQIPAAWKALDEFVIAAHRRGLNILMQAPVVGGNAGGPPLWAGRREPEKSAPQNMDALADFAGKLAERYRPGGTLAQREGWGFSYGIRAWELDNEPESYRTNWEGQPADYAEFVTKASFRIKQADPQALILAPGMAGGGHGGSWLEGALDTEKMQGSPAFRQQDVRYSIGPSTDVVSFHIYEGLDTFFSGRDMTVERAFRHVRAVFEEWENRPPGFEYPRKQEYWHTEGNFDFIGVLSEERRAAWRFQFFTRAFAAGIRKVVVMDASPPEQIAVRSYLEVLPNPFPMLPATEEIELVEGKAVAFRHPDGTRPVDGQVWIVWAQAGTGNAIITLPVHSARAELVYVGGHREKIPSTNGQIRVQLTGDPKMPAPILVVDREEL